MRKRNFPEKRQREHLRQDCLPDCEETHYTATVSAAPFRSCDFKNLGLSSLCNMGDATGATANIDPPIWGANVISQYREGITS